MKRVLIVGGSVLLLIAIPLVSMVRQARHAAMRTADR